MPLKPYRATLALPGIRSLLVVATLARVPITAGAVTLTLHVVTDLRLGYGAAGLVGAAFTVGGSLGAPVMGRLTDRHGLRPVLVLTTVAEVLFWSLAQAMPYGALLVAALGGFLALPAFSIARQSIAALTPESHRLPAFALDSITTELSFMTGPALGVLIATTAGPRVAMLSIAGGILASGIALWLLDPPIRADHEEPPTTREPVPRRSWLRPRFMAVLAVTMATAVLLAGTDVSVVAALRHAGELSWTGLVMALWAFYSLVGGFAYGTVRRSLSPLALLAPMALLTIPVGLGGRHWWLLALLLLPAGALCAPLITATADAASRMTPPSARGEAMGLHNSSLTAGIALGGPLAGLAIDNLSPPWGFATVGALSTLIALAILPTALTRRPATPTTDPTTPTTLATTPATPATLATDPTTLTATPATPTTDPMTPTTHTATPITLTADPAPTTTPAALATLTATPTTLAATPATHEPAPRPPQAGPATTPPTANPDSPSAAHLPAATTASTSTRIPAATTTTRCRPVTEMADIVPNPPERKAIPTPRTPRSAAAAS